MSNNEWVVTKPGIIAMPGTTFTIIYDRNLFVIARGYQEVATRHTLESAKKCACDLIKELSAMGLEP
jgi:hypothetical protein